MRGLAWLAVCGLMALEARAGPPDGLPGCLRCGQSVPEALRCLRAEGGDGQHLPLVTREDREVEGPDSRRVPGLRLSFRFRDRPGGTSLGEWLFLQGRLYWAQGSVVAGPRGHRPAAWPVDPAGLGWSTRRGRRVDWTLACHQVAVEVGLMSDEEALRAREEVLREGAGPAPPV